MQWKFFTGRQNLFIQFQKDHSLIKYNDNIFFLLLLTESK